MKITFIEEIESRHAWLGNMYCPKCICGKYKIHHQLKPQTENSWWVECDECEHEGPAAPSRELAIKGWQEENEASN